jgi:hypothetical protein
MAKDETPGVLTCPFCGRADEEAAMLHVPIEHRVSYWLPEQVLCLQCSTAVSQAIMRELDNYNVEAKGDGLLHFGLGESSDPDPAGAVDDAAVRAIDRPVDEGVGKHRRKSSAASANRS